MNKKYCKDSLEKLCFNCYKYSNYACPCGSYKTLEKLIEDHFELIERITPVNSKIAVTDEIMYYVLSLEGDIKKDVASQMGKFLLQKNIIEFEKEHDKSRCQTVYKGTIYVIRPKGERK